MVNLSVEYKLLHNQFESFMQLPLGDEMRQSNGRASGKVPSVHTHHSRRMFIMYNTNTKVL